MSILDGALAAVGVNLPVDPVAALTTAITDFATQNIPPQTLAAISTGVNIASLLNQPSATLGSPLANVAPGDWEAIHYADDLNAHYPKYKFLFKVKFVGFAAQEFQRYVTACDKPRVKFVHSDVNYYNFRTRVLTATMFEPLTITMLDEQDDTTNQFFASYLAARSMQGNGKADIAGGKDYSSTIPYDNGYSQGKQIIIEQVFAFGTKSNRFTFTNPRIESFDFDGLSMEENGGSLLTLTFSYDALACSTVSNSTLYSWGQTDLLKGGGTSGMPNAGASSVDEGGQYASVPANGVSALVASSGAVQGGLSYAAAQAGYAAINALPPSLAGLTAAGSIIPVIGTFNQPSIVSSAPDLIARDMQQTLASVSSGANLVFGGRTGPTTLEDAAAQGSALPEPITPFSDNSASGPSFDSGNPSFTDTGAP